VGGRHSIGRPPHLRPGLTTMDEDRSEIGLIAANRFFDGLLAGDLAELEAACAPDSVLWINLTEQERPLRSSLPGFARLRSKVPDLRMEAVRRREVPGGFVEQHVLVGTMPDGEMLRVVGCFLGTVADGRITRLEEYVDGGQAAGLSALLKGG
jgi:uncharacterized protein